MTTKYINSCIKEEVFKEKGDLADIFDIVVKDAINIMKNENDKIFLVIQREDTISCSKASEV